MGDAKLIGMTEAIYLPVTEKREITALLDELPLAVDREHFIQFVLGFPRRYLVNTARLEIVKHYLLGENLGERNVISSLYFQEGFWKLILLTRDRERLFSRITGTLSCFGMDIRSAEAFSNANLLVLDTFLFADPHGHLEQRVSRDDFQHLVEEVVEGKRDIELLLRQHLDEVAFDKYEVMEAGFDNEIHPSCTRLRVVCRNHVGLTYLLSHCISTEGFSIEMAYVGTTPDTSEQQYYIQRQGGKLTEAMQADLKRKLESLAEAASSYAPE